MKIITIYIKVFLFVDNFYIKKKKKIYHKIKKNRKKQKKRDKNRKIKVNILSTNYKILWICQKFILVITIVKMKL